MSPPRLSTLLWRVKSSISCINCVAITCLFYALRTTFTWHERPAHVCFSWIRERSMLKTSPSAFLQTMQTPEFVPFFSKSSNARNRPSQYERPANILEPGHRVLAADYGRPGKLPTLVHHCHR